MKFEEIDNVIGTPEALKVYEQLKEVFYSESNVNKNEFSAYNGGDKKNVELLWRLAYICQDLAAQAEEKSAKKNYVFEGQQFAIEAVAVDGNNFNALKFAAALTGLKADYVGMKERIQCGHKFKGYLDRAIAINATDSSVLHMRGRFSYNVASLSWIERKTASLFFATPPTATYDQAITDFVAAYKQREDWIDNVYYLAKAYMAKGDKVNAKKFFNYLVTLEAVDDNERCMQKDAQKALKSLK